MAVETEVKIELADIDEFREKLQLLNPSLLSARHFEDNFVLDYLDGRMRSRGCLLRVRKTKGKESVTFKGRPQPSALFKRREELETPVDSADTMLRILGQLGMEVWFRYQKYREEFSLALTSGPAGELKVALDVTPIGNYAELEGSEEGIREGAARLGLKESQFLRDSYYSLFLQFCRQRGEEPGHMVFSMQGGGSSAPG
ncbi:MAG: class IV adenylate cyclase [Acidobacteriia bacterium]|nr:class IV adenylate cyclase [Terriglobia bacterium]